MSYVKDYRAEFESCMKMINFYTDDIARIRAKQAIVMADLGALAGEYAGISDAQVPGVWDCGDPTNKFLTCIYDDENDRSWDACVFCGESFNRED